MPDSLFVCFPKPALKKSHARISLIASGSPFFLVITSLINGISRIRFLLPFLYPKLLILAPFNVNELATLQHFQAHSDSFLIGKLFKEILPEVLVDQNPWETRLKPSY